MVNIERNVRQERIRQRAEHVLFVEGKDDSAIDPLALRLLLPTSVDVRSLGASYHITSVAQALHRHHPNYYFLIDRDHYDDQFVQQCWDNFPDPNTCNLLVWPRRELENYFLVPEYLMKSQYISSGRAELEKAILQCCQRILYFDVANQVIISIREDVKRCKVDLFKRADDFSTADIALERIYGILAQLKLGRIGSRSFGKREIRRRFDDVLSRITAGKSRIEHNHGRWLELLKGKNVLPTIVNKCFRVVDANGNALQGRNKVNEVVKGLVRKPIEDQPRDFQRLYEIISNRIAAE